jgi:hypothetical protein
MIEDLIKNNNSLVSRIKELEKELSLLKIKYKCVKEFSRGMSFNNPMQYEKLKEELKRIENEQEGRDTTQEIKKSGTTEEEIL